MSEDSGQAFSTDWARLKLRKAKVIATSMHDMDGQMYGPLPYEFHLAHVENVIQRFHKSEKPHTWYLRIAAWLHDLVEDTPIDIVTVRVVFGDNIADIVWAVTDEPLTEEELNSGLKNNRKNRKAKTYIKLKESELGTTLKLADRIANMENCHSWDNYMLSMYEKEYTEFREQLYNDNHSDKIKRMWKYLDRLSE